jgi:hypothetical protein
MQYGRPLLASELVQATGLRPPPRLWCVPMPAPLRLQPGTPVSRSQPAQPDHGARLRSASPSSPTTEVAVCLDRATAPCARASLARPTPAAGESASRGMEMRPRRRWEKQGPLAEEPARPDTWPHVPAPTVHVTPWNFQFQDVNRENN